MIPPIEVFKADRQAANIWLQSVDSLADALTLIQETGSGSYLILSRATGHQDIYEVGADGNAIFQRRL